MYEVVMKTWHFAVLGLMLSVFAGCRTDPAIPILERELRLKEDEIYRLRATVDELQEENAQTDRRRSSGASDSRTSDGPKPPAMELPSQPTDKVPESLKTPAGMKLPPELEVPEGIEGPSKPSPSRKESQPLTRESQADGPSLGMSPPGTAARPPRVLPVSREDAVPMTPSSDNRRVVSIALNRTMTGGIGAEDRSGDSGLLVVVEPRDREGRSVDAPAAMCVVVLDPAAQGEAVRVARWDFSAAETTAMFRRSGSTAAIHLTMTWPHGPPKHNNLRLFVRYMTADGRKLQAEQAIEVALPGDRTAQRSPVEAVSSPKVEQSNARPTSRPSSPSTSQDTPPMNDAEARRPVWSPDRRY
jgi:hypothetical protein